MSTYVMPINELETIPDGTVVWMELRSYDNLITDHARIQPMVKYGMNLGNAYSAYYIDDYKDDYGTMERMWNYRPTIETMDNTPWIIKEEWQK